MTNELNVPMIGTLSHSVRKFTYGTKPAENVSQFDAAKQSCPELSKYIDTLLNNIEKAHQDPKFWDIHRILTDADEIRRKSNEETKLDEMDCITVPAYGTGRLTEYGQKRITEAIAKVKEKGPADFVQVCSSGATNYFWKKQP